MGGTVFGAGVSGAAFDLDGNDDWMWLGSDYLIGSGANPFTATFCVNLRELPPTGGYDILLWLRQDTQFMLGITRQMVVAQDLLVPLFRGSEQWGIPIDLGGLKDQWTHVAVVYTGGDKNAAASYRTYLNGQMLPAGSVSLGPAGGSTNDGNGMGIDPFNSGGHLAGRLDELQIFARALTQEEIEALARAGLTAVGPRSQEERRSLAVAVEPNPAKGAVRIAWSGGSGNVEVTVFDVQGRAVVRHTSEGADVGMAGSWTWHLQSSRGVPTANGVYVVRVHDRAGNRVSRNVLVVR